MTGRTAGVATSGFAPLLRPACGQADPDPAGAPPRPFGDDRAHP